MSQTNEELERLVRQDTGGSRRAQIALTELAARLRARTADVESLRAEVETLTRTAAQAVVDAVAAEREACAAVVEHEFDLCSLSGRCPHVKCEMGQHTAAAIRARGGAR